MQRSGTVVALLVLLVAAAQMPSLGAHASLITGSVNLGEACFYDEECETITTFCRDRRLCSCKERFREAEGRCVATVGARCSSDHDCSSLESSQCEERECVCREGYVRESMDYACLPVVYVYQGACEEDTQCQLSFGDFAMCQYSMCLCRSGYHFADGACWFSRGLGDTCANTTECSYDQDQRHRLHCDNNICRCKPPFHQNDRVCDDGAAQIAVSLAAICFVVIRFIIL